jgi:hypothetical protein
MKTAAHNVDLALSDNFLRRADPFAGGFEYNIGDIPFGFGHCSKLDGPPPPADHPEQAPTLEVELGRRSGFNQVVPWLQTPPWRCNTGLVVCDKSGLLTDSASCRAYRGMRSSTARLR